MILGRCATKLGVAALVAFAASLTLPACTSTARVTAVYMALEGDGARQRGEFFTDTKEIHCIAEATIGREGVTIEGTIRQLQAYDFASNSFISVDRVLAYAEIKAARSQESEKFDIVLKAGSGAEQEARVENAPYVAGRYECEVQLDGRVERTALFNIAFPPCPPAVLVAGTRCFGFYRENDECPAAGASGAPDPTCICTLASGWKC